MKCSDGTPATSQDVCYSWGLALAAIKDKTSIGYGYLEPGLKDAGVTKIECPDDSTFIAYTTDQSDRIFQVYIPILPKHVWGKFNYKNDRQGEVRRAARGHRSVHPRRVEDRPVRAVRPQPQLLGQARDSPTRSSCSSSRTTRHDGPGAEGGRARLRPQRERGPVQAAPGRPDLHRGRRQGERLDASWRSTPTAPAPARRSPTAGRRRRRCSTRRSATRSGYAVDKQALVDRVLGGFGDVGTTDHPAGPVRVARRARQARATSTSSSPSRSSTRPGICSNGDGKRLDKEGKPIQLRLYYPNTDDDYAKSAQFVQEWYGQLGHRRDAAGLRQRPRSATSSCRPRATARPSTTSSCGAGAATRTRTRLLDIFRCDADRHDVGQPVLQPGLRRALRAGARRRPATERHARWRRCRT